MKILIIGSLMGALVASALAAEADKGLSAKVTLSPVPNVALSCNPPVPVTGKTPPASYNFYRGTVKGGPYATLAGNSGGTNCALTDIAVQYGTTYYYVARSLTSSGNESTNSNEAIAVVGANPIPDPPTGLTALPVISRNVPLRWHAPKETVAAYKMFRKASTSGTFVMIAAGIQPPQFIDRKVPVGTYDYQVRAVVPIGGGVKVLSRPSNTVQVAVQ